MRKCCEEFLMKVDGVENRGWGGGHLCCAPCHPCYMDDEELDAMRTRQRLPEENILRRLYRKHKKCTVRLRYKEFCGAPVEKGTYSCREHVYWSPYPEGED